MSRSLGANARRIRLAKGLTLRRVAKASSYAESTLCEIEKGEIDPPAGRVPKLARALGVPVCDLYEGVR
jgi:transcriptional regulator with XRE-family HTH domain